MLQQRRLAGAPCQQLVERTFELLPAKQPKLLATAAVLTILVKQSLEVDIEQVLSLLSHAALQSERVLREPPPQTFLSKVESAGLEFTLVSWVSDPEAGYLQTRSQINTAVVQALRQAGIELSKAPQQVYWRSPAP
jgi:small-conductance mechanosensitive channel